MAPSWWGLRDYLESNHFQAIPITKLSDGGHGDTLSVKMVLPTFCQARCMFCFNRYTAETQCHEWLQFMRSMSGSLAEVFKNSGHRKISLDITGGEPTFDPEKFTAFLDGLYKVITYCKTMTIDQALPNIDKIVLTTNGYRLDEMLEKPEFLRTVDIVNISMHHYDYLRRQEIFGTKIIPSNGDIYRINYKLHKHHKKATAVAVVYAGEFNGVEFNGFVRKFAHEALNLGFDDVRIRLDYMDTGHNEDLFDVEFPQESIFETDALKVKTIQGLELPVNIYKGVPDISQYVVGPEMIIDDNGLLYLDYIKEKPIMPEEIRMLAENVYVRN